MTNESLPYDVFVTYASIDKSIGEMVVSQLEYNSLFVATAGRLKLHRPRILQDLVREVIAESNAVVAVVGPQSIGNPNVMFEFGAAFAWNKACYLVTNGISNSRLPYALSMVHHYSISDVDKIADEIKDLTSDLSDEDIVSLSEIYHELGISVDKLFSKPVQLSRITREFNGSQGRSLSPEQILQHLLRLRKKGMLSTKN